MSTGASALRSPARWQITAAVVVLCLIWGSTWVVIKDGLDELPPFLSAGVRFVIAGVVMTGVAAVLHRREGGEEPPVWLWVLVASTNFVFSYGVVYHVEQVLPSGLVCVLWGVYPMMMAVCGHLFLDGERLRAVHWLGFGVGFVGLVLLFHADVAHFGVRGRGAALLLLLSPVATALGTTLLKRYGREVSSLKLNRNAMLLGGAQLLGLAAASGEPLVVAWSPAAIGGTLYLAIFGTVVTFGLYHWALRHAAASRMSLIAYVTPAIALALGWVVASEPVRWTTIAGAVLIVGGIGFATRTPTKIATDPRAPA